VNQSGLRQSQPEQRPQSYACRQGESAWVESASAESESIRTA
jgi:hypothetical protein